MSRDELFLIAANSPQLEFAAADTVGREGKRGQSEIGVNDS
jgi:hypothetical protein